MLFTTGRLSPFVANTNHAKALQKSVIPNAENSAKLITKKQDVKTEK
jgi:hypothetical protein